ncbi:MAG: Flp pilus assembly protein CpaB [Devosiaceae bacterium]|nr:Flp pilus assembly protein CpaB [Devosiaceae bacterium MH13]
MKSSRIIVFGIAAVAGGLAWIVAGNLAQPPAPQVVEVAPTVPTTRVLVARYDLGIGERLSEAAMEWRDWPEENISATFFSEGGTPNAIRDLSEGIVTSPIYAGEPIREPVIATAGRGFMSALLPAGRRAVSLRVGTESRAAGFILPNDRIDVILTRVERASGRDNSDAFLSDTILENIRVLAIDQTFEERDGEQFVTGEIATLELSPGEAELIAMADEMGELSLVLRSIADIEEDTQDMNEERVRSLRTGGGDSGAVRMIRFGISGG